MAADETVLGKMHDAVANVFIEALEGTTLPGYSTTDDEGNKIEVPAQKMLPSAAILQAATKFLKDNNITCAPAPDNALGALEQKMKDRKAATAARRADFIVASEDMSFTAGLPN